MATVSVLFLCVGNSCRSPMAEAMARTMGRGRIDAHSAGLHPTGWIADNTLVTLRAMGYPVDGLHSKGLDSVPLGTIDVLVSLIGDDGLRLLPSTTAAHRESWSIRDPYGDDEQVYRAVARTLEERIRRLLDELLGTAPG